MNANVVQTDMPALAPFKFTKPVRLIGETDQYNRTTLQARPMTLRTLYSACTNVQQEGPEAYAAVHVEQHDFTAILCRPVI